MPEEAVIINAHFPYFPPNFPVRIPYLTFESNAEFTLRMSSKTKTWNGTLYYSTDIENWNEWSGTTTINSSNGKLYLRGKNNTYMTGGDGTGRFFVITPSSNNTVSCKGNIENLLDWETAYGGSHPSMARFCFNTLFKNCSCLDWAPDLPAPVLAYCCYSEMFVGCTSLTTAPALPATTLADYCYYMMFVGCTSLTTAPALPAITLTTHCYAAMFVGCTSLTTAPALPATTLADYCYGDMFDSCTQLSTLPRLATDLNIANCAGSMFAGCSLVKVSETKTGDYQNELCYCGSRQAFMFLTTGGTYTSTGEAGHTYYTSNQVV